MILTIFFCTLAIAAILELILFLRFPNDSFHATVAFALAKLYSNSLLVLFNNRKQTPRSAPSSNHFDLPRMNPFRSDGSTNVSLPKNGIRVEHSTFIDMDDGDSIPLDEDRVSTPRSLSLVRCRTNSP